MTADVSSGQLGKVWYEGWIPFLKNEDRADIVYKVNGLQPELYFSTILLKATLGSVRCSSSAYFEIHCIDEKKSWLQSCEVKNECNLTNTFCVCMDKHCTMTVAKDVFMTEVTYEMPTKLIS